MRSSPASPSVTAPRSARRLRARICTRGCSQSPCGLCLLCTEIMAEARRHPEIARISASFDADVRKWLLDLLRAAAECGDIPSDADLDAAATMLMLIADGVWWRRALDPNFDAQAVVPMFMDIARHLLRGRPKNLTCDKNLTGDKRLPHGSN